MIDTDTLMQVSCNDFSWTFDRVFNPISTQQTVYDETVKPMLTRLMSGMNGWEGDVVDDLRIQLHPTGIRTDWKWQDTHNGK